ncbi:LamG domain-containing protein [Lacipirellula sp.]|uniref:LamG domain-containing protein n=1 Tax=Lacipirellula sp. TaxID=2691419 RepID=UPI003D135055
MGISFFRVASAAAIALFGIGSTTFAAGYSQAITSTPGLLAYYQFSGDYSSSVNGYSGTATTGASIGAAGTGPQLGDQPNNRPLLLDGTDGNGVTTSVTSGISTAGSIVAFINVAQLPSVAGRHFSIAGVSQSGNDFDLLLLQDDNTIRFYTDNTGPVIGPALTASDLGKNIFVAATYDSILGRTLYVNGVQVATTAAGVHVAPVGTPFAIGYATAYANRAFVGSMDEVALFNRSLTAAEVAGIYASRAAVPEPASVAMLVIAAAAVAAHHRRCC